MEVELGLKITRTIDEGSSTSISDFQFAKDRAGPVFLSKQTNAAFTLTAHLKGYKKENIEINISKDGSDISVSGEKEVQEMQMIPFKKEIKTKGFIKKFKIPDGVVLDRIKAKYYEKDDDRVLTIVMPKQQEVVNSTPVTQEEEIKQSAHETEKIPDIKTEEEENIAPIKKQRSKKPWKPCPPLVLGGGSTLLLSIIFLVIHFIRMKKSST